MYFAVLVLLGCALLAATRASSAAPGNVFHNFFYTSDPKTRKLVKLPLKAEQAETFKTLIGGKLTEISEEKYWRSFGRFMITHAPQGYIAWENKIHWLVLLPEVDANHKFVKGSHGIHLIEITDGKMRHLWQPLNKDDDKLRDLAQAPWDWLLDGEGRELQKPMTAAEEKILKANIGWTDAVHERMDKKFPSDKEWKD